MNAVATSIWARLLQAVSVATDPRVDSTLEERKRYLLAQLGSLFDADVQLWILVYVKQESAQEGMVVSVLDQGWRSDAERVAYFGLVSNPDFRKLHAPLVENCSRIQTTARISSLQNPSAEAEITAMFRAVGISGVLVSGMPVGDSLQSTIALYRFGDNQDFTANDEELLHVVAGNISWLHTMGTDVEVKNQRYKLSPREHEVIVHLMDGLTQNGIAEILRISSHTVGDHIKSIYRKLDVSSRAELLSKFIAGDNL